MLKIPSPTSNLRLCKIEKKTGESASWLLVVSRFELSTHVGEVGQQRNKVLLLWPNEGSRKEGALPRRTENPQGYSAGRRRGQVVVTADGDGGEERGRRCSLRLAAVAV